MSKEEGTDAGDTQDDLEFRSFTAMKLMNSSSSLAVRPLASINHVKSDQIEEEVTTR